MLTSPRRLTAALVAPLLVGLTMCSPAAPGLPAAPPSSAAPAASIAASATASAVNAPSVAASASAASMEAPSIVAVRHPDAIAANKAEELLFLDRASATPGVEGCRGSADDRARIRCLIGLRFDADPEARTAALALYEAAGDVAGVEEEQDMDGGFRGTIHLVPELPVGKHRRHLAWVAEAARDFEVFFEALAASSPQPVRYRWRDLALRFFRSVNRTTPSAYAHRWTVAYNVSGSLHGSAAAVRETLFHEIFHLNDAARGGWSARALGATFDAIVARCGTRVACLKPYAPSDTMVRGGTYYAFQPGNGESVHEYAAELALRYYREHRAVLRGERLAAPAFKCGPDENRRAWAALVSEFFGGVDRVPACSG